MIEASGKVHKLSKKQTGYRLTVMSIIAAVSICISLMYVSVITTLIGLTTLFYAVLVSKTKKQITLSGIIFGATLSLILNAWMIPVVSNYAKAGFFISIISYLVSTITISFVFGILFFLYSVLSIKEDKKNSLLNNVLLMSALWVLFEWFRGELFSSIPWLSFSLGITEGRILYLIQHAQYGGVYILSFILVISTYLTAFAIYKRMWNLLLVPLSLLLIQFISGAALFNNVSKRISNEKGTSFKAALVLPALEPETVWNDNSADALVSKLFQLNNQALKSGAEMIVWTETVVPWTYKPDDDFLKALSEPSHSKISVLIGMNSKNDSSGSILCNSVYFLNNYTTPLSQYDKQDLLTVVEKPLFGDDSNLILPFLSTAGIKMQAGENYLPINTPWGKAGLMICNESTSSSIATNHVKNNAGFLVNMGNDSWFSNTYIPRQHFYNCRLRAIETRKDILVNNNMGYAGAIKATGEVVIKLDGRKSQVSAVEINPNSISIINQNFFLLSISIILFLTLLYFFTINYKSINY